MCQEHDLDARIAQWRTWQERTSSLSPRELDELEDHLRAHIDLEMELSATLGPAQAFRAGCHAIGTGATLSKEFAKVGNERWRRMFLQGWVLYAASFFLPTVEFGFDHGYQLALDITLRDLVYPQVLAFVFLPNLAMLMTAPVLWGRKTPSPRCLKWLLGVVGVGAVGAAVVQCARFLVGPPNVALWDALAGFGIGYWTWTASLIFVAGALQLGSREWASAKPELSTRVPSQGAHQ